MLEKGKYGSPRWTGEILDCSMPMTFDTYSQCSYNCLYCFSFFQKINLQKDYKTAAIGSVSVDRIKKMFLLESKSKGDQAFFPYIKDRKVMQWGGMSDQFDNNEKQYGVTLELLEFFKSINYPLSFSTKSNWFVHDGKYRKLIKGQKNWNFKVSIITGDEKMAHAIEKGAPTVAERLDTIKQLSDLGVTTTLRLRPFILGASDKTFRDLIRKAKEAGATAVSTEFFCLEGRAGKALKQRYAEMSRALGFDIYDYYRKASNSKTGYMRLSRNAKEPYVKEMKKLCDELGLRFYVSDAHFKEYSENGSCCGLDESWNYSRGQFTEALIIARKNGKVFWKDIEPNVRYLKDTKAGPAFANRGGSTWTATWENRSIYDFVKYHWNNTRAANSPYKYFGGVLFPIGLDEDKNVIYEYRGDKVKELKLPLWNTDCGGCQGCPK